MLGRAGKTRCCGLSFRARGLLTGLKSLLSRQGRPTSENGQLSYHACAECRACPRTILTSSMALMLPAPTPFNSFGCHAMLFVSHKKRRCLPLISRQAGQQIHRACIPPLRPCKCRHLDALHLHCRQMRRIYGEEERTIGMEHKYTSTYGSRSCHGASRKSASPSGESCDEHGCWILASSPYSVLYPTMQALAQLCRRPQVTSTSVRHLLGCKRPVITSPGRTSWSHLFSSPK